MVIMKLTICPGLVYKVSTLAYLRLLMNTSSPIRYKKVLNAAQHEAVLFDKGPLLVIAGAGSGKTRTLTYRVARLVEDGTPPAAILLLTFTRRASQEMLKRATDLLDERCERVSGGTFHSFANAVLRRYATLVGFDNRFTIIDRADMESLIGRLKKDMGLGSKDRAFPKTRTLANIFSGAANKVLEVDDILFEDYAHLNHHLDSIVELSEAYQQHKSDHNLMDYDDLLIHLNRLLREQPEIRHRISSAYQFYMVDEYQDTNQIQAEILYLLTRENDNIMVVGDDSQSIYAFRGAEIENILSFPEKYPDATIIRLEENYRSVQPVLNLANAIIDNAAYKYTKSLFSRRRSGAAPLLLRTRSENDQSRFVIDKIRDITLQGVRLNQIAVLFRAGFHSFDLEIELGREGLPFIKVGGFKFMDKAHIKDVLAYLKVIHNADDSISWFRILMLLEKVGPKNAALIFDALRQQPDGFKGLQNVRLPKAIRRQTKTLAECFAAIDPQQMTLPAVGETILNYYLPILKAGYDDHPKRTRDLEQLLSIMERYSSLESFLTDMAIEPPGTSMDSTFTARIADGNRLTLSTIHSAKGLEWHSVFIIWALDGRFPSMQSINKQDALEEELRLMYVAATRAKENLFIAYPGQVYDRATGNLLYRPSRFLDGIPEKVLHRKNLV